MLADDNDAYASRDIDDGAHEADQFHAMSAWGGHAGPRSSWPYINQLEEPIRKLVAAARPMAYCRTIDRDGLRFFREISSKSSGRRESIVGPRRRVCPPTSAAEVGLTQRLQLTASIARGMRDYVASASAWLDASLGSEILLQVVGAMRVDKFASPDHGGLDQAIECVAAYGAWALEAEHSKLGPVVAALQQRIESAAVEKLYAIWNAWRQIRVGECICLSDAWAARLFIEKLLELGIDRRVLLIKSRVGAPPVDRMISGLGLKVLPLKSRKELVQHRLQIVDEGVDPESAVGRQVSVVGLNWLMVLVSSWLASQGRQSWSAAA